MLFYFWNLTVFSYGVCALLWMYDQSSFPYFPAASKWVLSKLELVKLIKLVQCFIKAFVIIAIKNKSPEVGVVEQHFKCLGYSYCVHVSSESGSGMAQAKTHKNWVVAIGYEDLRMLQNS